MTIRSQFRAIPHPPSHLTGEMRQWAQQLTDHINGMPQFSLFSFSTPNSNVTAVPGTLGQNLASGVSVFWSKQTGTNNTGWVAIA